MKNNYETSLHSHPYAKKSVVLSCVTIINLLKQWKNTHKKQDDGQKIIVKIKNYCTLWQKHTNTLKKQKH